ncbi:MAG: undecaprenyl/decaprenyl-phosphate alpha-N-acetylglucosaminyl 1-phosphate transferase [Gemmatimonadetes bacterium]|nr:undecaprenyl/decaprenyl-phosphate alpha-N-acetylglucosaminyl 1-phosphate transferase [Gemmatimonadota bacterium]
MLGFICAAALLASLLVTPLVIRAATARNLFDIPSDARRVHTRPIPRLGGVAVFAAMVLALLLAMLAGALPSEVSGERSRFFEGILLGGGILFAVGLWDDLRGLPPLVKLLAQCVAASVVFTFGFQVDVISVGPTGELPLGWLSFPLTILWVVGVTNAFNLIDGLDGLATGIAIVALGTTLAVALALGNAEVAIVCVALLGALLGFLRYNFSPARIFLGDSGSLFIGFMLAVLSVHGSVKSATAVLAIVPLFALALPLLDTSLAIVRRWLRGVPLSGADARHIHHRLLAMGLTHRRAAVVLYVVATALAVLGVVLAFAPPAAVLVIALAGGGISLLLLLYGMRQLEYHEFAEAGMVLASGVRRVRRVIQDQIHARDIVQVIRQAETLRHLDAILEDNAPHFGFLGVEVCRETSSCRQRIAGLNGQTARAWKLDYPVTPRLFAEDDPYVLRIWCGLGDRNRPFGAERVARILAPAIESWLVSVGLVQQLSERGNRPLLEAHAGKLQENELEPALHWAARAGELSGGLRESRGMRLAQEAMTLHRARNRR